MHPISLVQIATHRHAFLYRVRPGSPYRSLKRLIENPTVSKIVQGATEETRELRRDLGIEARGFVDLPTVAKAAGFSELNLRALAASALGIRISKAAQRSDWSRLELTQAQLEYAATDAWACLAVHERIVSAAGNGGAGRPPPRRRS
jgi:ribonuclease D